ncbi:hypothetical protein GCM10023178_35350 [Actinomadura luteofluorescens]
MPVPVPGTPSLLRAINDRAALEALLARGPLTRPQISDLTGLSKPTASQLLARLEQAGLVVRDGVREGLPGRTAELYRINGTVPGARVATVLTGANPRPEQFRDLATRLTYGRTRAFDTDSTDTGTSSPIPNDSGHDHHAPRRKAQ